ncbi:hypothetical protein DRN73_02425 [Candidatus Pacearchaeota archaeon]|nr:MAG: hypothetical protein DRN73_02425 [Candidatus Pacearchaeota archaeon]
MEQTQQPPQAPIQSSQSQQINPASQALTPSPSQQQPTTPQQTMPHPTQTETAQAPKKSWKWWLITGLIISALILTGLYFWIFKT